MPYAGSLVEMTKNEKGLWFESEYVYKKIVLKKEHQYDIMYSFIVALDGLMDIENNENSKIS